MSTRNKPTYIRFKHHSFLFRLTNSLTNHQKYYTMIVIVLLGFGLLVYGLLQEFHREIAAIDAELTSNKLQEPLKGLHENVSKHYALMKRYNSGDRSVKGNLIQRQSLIDQDLRTIISGQEELDELLSSLGKSLYSSENDPLRIKDLQKDWEQLRGQLTRISQEEADQKHRQYLDSLSVVIRQIEEAVNPGSSMVMTSYYLAEITNYYLLRQQQGLSNLYRDLSQPEGTHQPVEDYVVVKTDFTVVSDIVEKALAEIEGRPEYHALEEALKDAFADYESFFTRFLFNLEQAISSGADSEQDLVFETKRALQSSFMLYGSVDDALEGILQLQRSEIVPWKYILLAVSLLVTVIGVFLGKFFVGRVVDSVKSLDMGYKYLTQGDFSARIPIQFDDEIGRASIGFNLMAEKFEGLIHQQSELLAATKRLASGDFSTRVHVDGDVEEEIKQLSKSFNNMAASFQEIIQKVQLLGDTLTTSAAAIAKTSKHYEDSTKNQDDTTRSILVTSGEISESAQEFATTISSVTQVVDQAANLATQGRTSLTTMESIMKQMVKASSDIAAKLGVLNEKAVNINLVITTITSVADQTNLLSLNAAIIADKAGDYGKSFSIIANEIRDLADQTAVATLDIEAIVDEMMSSVSASVMGVDDFIQEIREGVEQNRRVAEQLAQIIGQVQALAPRFELVNDGMQTQCDASKQINDAINRLSKTAHVTAESLHQFAITTRELNESATYLKEAVAKITKREDA
jgi:methyl-accepting chemotaxis protein WspA